MTIASRLFPVLFGGFLPTDIQGLTLWLRAESLIEDGIADGGQIETWRDESGEGNDVTEPTAGERPVLETSAFNGNTAARFDGSDDRLRRASFVNGAIAQPNEIFIVLDANATLTPDEWIIDGRGTDRHAIWADGGPQWSIFAGTVFQTGIAFDEEPHIFDAVFDGASSFLIVDDTRADGDAGTASMNGVVVGAANIETNSGPWDFTEIIIYNKKLSSGDRGRVKQYLKDKYGL